MVTRAVESRSWFEVVLCSTAKSATMFAIFPATPIRIGIMSFFESRSEDVLFCYLSLYDEFLTSYAMMQLTFLVGHPAINFQQYIT